MLTFFLIAFQLETRNSGLVLHKSPFSLRWPSGRILISGTYKLSYSRKILLLFILARNVRQTITEANRQCAIGLKGKYTLKIPSKVFKASTNIPVEKHLEIFSISKISVFIQEVIFTFFPKKNFHSMAYI